MISPKRLGFWKKENLWLDKVKAGGWMVWGLGTDYNRRGMILISEMTPGRDKKFGKFSSKKVKSFDIFSKKLSYFD